MLHQQGLVVVYMSYFVRQIFLWGCSFPHDLVHFVRQLPFQNPKHPISSASTQRNTQAKTAFLSGWMTDYRSETEAMMITVHVHLRRGAFSCVTSVTLSNHLPWVPDRCKELGFSGSSSGALDRISRPLIPHTVPCRPGRRLLFVSKPLLTSTSYCHVVSWGSCHGEKKPPFTDSTVLITPTHCTCSNNMGNLFPNDVLIVKRAKINLNMTNKFESKFIMWPIREAGLPCLCHFKSLKLLFVCVCMYVCIYIHIKEHKNK